MSRLEDRLAGIRHHTDELIRWAPDYRAATATTLHAYPGNDGSEAVSGGGISDRVGNTVAGTIDHNADEKAELDDLLADVDRKLLRARGIVEGRVPRLPHPDRSEKHHTAFADSCISCARIGKRTPCKPGSTLCNWCDDWKLTRPMPLISMVRAHHEGKRMTTKLVEQLERAERPRRPKPKRKAK